MSFFKNLSENSTRTTLKFKDIFNSISTLATQKNPPLKNHLIYNDQNKKEMSKNLLLNRITTLNFAKNRLESLKDLKIKIKTQEPGRLTMAII